MMLVVADSSPLIALITIEHVSVLPDLFGSVIIPPEVFCELQQSNRSEPVRQFVAAIPHWLMVRSPVSLEPIPLIHAGERAAISLARELHADLLLIDEARERSAAAALHIPITGTIGVLELAADRRLLHLAEAFARIKRTGFGFLTNSLIKDCAPVLAHLSNGMLNARSMLVSLSAVGFAALMVAVRASAQSTRPVSPTATAIEWSTLTERERNDLSKLLDSNDWPVRVFGLMRLERYSGSGVNDLLRNRLSSDPAWQVRCFAIDQALRSNVSFTSEEFAKETEPHVLRLLLDAGVAPPEKDLAKIITKLLRTEDVDALVLGIELAAATDDKTLRAQAAQRTDRLLRNMDEGIALVVSRRMARVLQLPRTPETLDEWRVWLGTQRDLVQLPPRATNRRRFLPVSMIAAMDDETFTRLLDYLDSLRQRDLDLVICMDATASMVPMVNQARAGIDSLILFLRDISREMRLGFVAYRDHDNRPVYDAQPFTNDVTVVRNFLFNVRITGGADLPEAVLDGLRAAWRMKWNAKATREIVVVGDAPPHAEDMYQVRELLDGMRDSGIVVHTAHIPMEFTPGRLAGMSEERAEQERQELEQYNTSTSATFKEMADLGGGETTTMKKAAELVPAVMHFTIDDGWWSVFDEFYERYLELCR